MQLGSGRHIVQGVLEVPILTSDPLRLGRWRKERLFTLTASSYQESVELLRAARRIGISPVVLLSHPFEFIKDRKGGTAFRPNPVNQSRLERLCAFISDHPRDFVAQDFRGGAREWVAGEEEPSTKIGVSLPAMLRRTIENRVNDLL